MAKKRKVKDSGDHEAKPDIYGSFNAVLDDVARKMSDADTLDDVVPMSTGSLTLDLIMGGGIRPAMYTNFGPEQSAKTTGALLVMASAIKQNVPIVSLRDFEGSTGNSIPYVMSILKTSGITLNKEQLFGKKDPKTGKWAVAPRVRYSANTMGVSFFNWFAAVLRRLPDKKMLEGEWYLVYDDSKEIQAKFGEFADKTMPKKYGAGVYLKAPDPGLQGVVILDSYPNMNPTSKDEDQQDNSLAAQARMFSKNLPRVKGYLASKKVALLGINQLRDVPMAMFGPKEQEPGGKALRYNSDVRLRWYPRALSAIPLWPKASKKGGYELEKSLSGGVDKYKYVHVKAAKNKLSEPEREGFIRLWTKDSQGVAHGIDPVFDTIYYLRTTGQLEGKKRLALTLKWNGEKNKKVITWDDLKLWILGSKEDMIKMSKKAGMSKPMNLRSACFKQLAKGRGEELYKEVETADEQSGKKSNDEESDGE
jgi:RecA/RadA recombinase